MIMNEETKPPFEIEPKTDAPADSHMFNVSVRGWIVVMVVTTVCYMSITAKDIKEPLYTLVGLCVGYYFGQGNKQKEK